MEFIYIQYRLRTADGRELLFRLRFDPKTFESVEATPASPPAWTALDFHQCSNCPLKKEEHPHCPAALRIAPVIQACEPYDAFTPMHVEVTMPERTTVGHRPLQKALASILGLVMATSGCPHTVPLRTLARYHLPFATEDETLYRVASLYLLAQYFRHKDGQTPDLDLEGLIDMYRRLQGVNEGMSERLKAAGVKPALSQVIMPLDMLSHKMPYNIRGSLELVRPAFEPLIGISPDSGT
jgi:hypothetical protein